MVETKRKLFKKSIFPTFVRGTPVLSVINIGVETVGVGVPK